MVSCRFGISLNFSSIYLATLRKTFSHANIRFSSVNPFLPFFFVSTFARWQEWFNNIIRLSITRLPDVMPHPSDIRCHVTFQARSERFRCLLMRCNSGCCPSLAPLIQFHLGEDYLIWLLAHDACAGSHAVCVVY